MELQKLVKTGCWSIWSRCSAQIQDHPKQVVIVLMLAKLSFKLPNHDSMIKTERSQKNAQIQGIGEGV
jgi:hypothetical protein